MSRSFVDILLNPNAFFQNAMTEKENLKMPALIVLCGAIVGAIYGYLIGGLTGSMMSAIMPGMGTIILISVVIFAMIGTFLFWAVWAGAFYLVSMIFKGKGEFKRCLEVVGYGYIPQIFGALITVIVALEYIPRIVVPQITSAAAQDPQMIQAATAALMHDPAMMEMTQITTVISIVFLLWSANCWIFGMKHARSLSMRDAALCVGIPVLVFVLYSVYSISGV
jgi:hypothetical protein